MVNAITSGDILSAEQLKRHSKVYAGPGAGKTYFLVENVKNIEKKFKHLEDFIGQSICECDFYNYTSTIIDAITEDMTLDLIDICEDLIYDFAYNKDWGEDDSVELEIDGVKKTASNFEELYDLIQEITGNA
jgi:hypothetical protein